MVSRPPAPRRYRWLPRAKTVRLRDDVDAARSFPCAPVAGPPSASIRKRRPPRAKSSTWPRSAHENRAARASGRWSVRDGYLHTKIESSTLPSLMPVGFAAAWKLKEVTGKEMIYVSAANGRTRVEYRKE